MNERIERNVLSVAEGLTTKAKTTYSKSGDIFMAEPGSGENLGSGVSGKQEAPKIPQFTERPKEQIFQKEGTKQGQKWESSSSNTNIAAEAWGKYYHSAGKRIEDLPYDERQAVMLAIREGRPPEMRGGSDAEEEATRRLERAAKKREQLSPEPGEERQQGLGEEADEGGQEDIKVKEAINRLRRSKKEQGGGEERKEDIMTVLRSISPHTNPLPKEIIEYAFEFDDTLEYLVNRIVAQPLDAETSNYRLSFYGGINLEQIKDTLKAESETGKGDPALAVIRKNQYQKVLLISEAVALFHEMNLQIVTGNLEGFVSGSRAITPKQLQVMQNVPGVAQVMRIFDQEYQKTLAQDKYINDENYNKMLGIERNEKGEITKVKGTIENQVRSLVEKKILSGELENWQVDWAINTGKILFNLTLRAAEQISLGEVQKGDKGLASIPQEHAARLMNWLGWQGFRFTISEVRGGLKLADMARDNYQKNRQIQGYGKMSLEKIGGKNVKDFELAGMFDVSGIWSSWRQNLIILQHSPTKTNGKETTIRKYMEEVKEAFEKEKRGALERNGYKGKKLDSEYKKLEKKEESELLKRIFLNEKGELKSEFNSALGILLKHSSITSLDKDKFINGLSETKEQIRVAIWKRVAKDNPLAMANLLHGLKEKDGEEVSLKDEHGKKDDWDSLAAKLTLLNEMRMERISQGEQVSLQELIDGEKTKENGIMLDDAEDKLLKRIQANGKNFAKDFANIRFPFTPFLNDVLFEKADYGEAGAAFYQRRAGGDLSSFYNAGNEFVKLMDNPGGSSVDDALKVLHGVVQAIGSPQGTNTGQDKVAPFFEAYLNFIDKGGQIKGSVRRWMAKDSFYSWIIGIARKPNSLAQEYAGPQAPSVDEFEMHSVLDKALHAGVTRTGKKDENGILMWTDLNERFRKKFKTKFGWLFAAFLRDIVPLFALAVLGDAGVRSARGK